MPKGGKREGAGRKPQGLSNQQVGRLLKAFKRKAKEEGQDAFDLLAEIAYNKTAYKLLDAGGVEVVQVEVPVSERRRAIELYATLTIVKRIETTIDDKRQGPTIGLPPMKDRPAEAEHPTVATKPPLVN